MGTVIAFPESRRYADIGGCALTREPASIIILPVIRIERFDEEPDDGPPGGGRGSRSRKGRPRPSQS